MRKIPSYPLFLLLFLFILAPMGAFAASVGSPETLGGFGKVAVGLEYDSLSQPLKLTSGSITRDVFREDFTASNMDMKTRTTYLVGTVGILPTMDAFFALGINRAKIGLSADYIGGASDDISVTDNSNLAYKLGVKGRIMEVSGINLNGMLQYAAFKMNGRFSVNGMDLDAFYDRDATYSTKTHVREWQAALTASKQMGRFSPYLGATWRRTSVSNTTAIQVTDVEGSYEVFFNAKAKEDHALDAVIGTGVMITEHLGAGVEYQPQNKEGAISASYAF
ncbi:MAG: hypothetical protein NUV61_03940 [Candidatus Azambacteria bacterium]|nr:hypothetical protein [Candidatus Azambacteria bacterium]